MIRGMNKVKKYREVCYSMFNWYGTGHSLFQPFFRPLALLYGLLMKKRKKSHELNSEAGYLIHVTIRFDIIQALIVIISTAELIPPFNTMQKNE